MDVAHFIFFLADKLVAGIQVACRGDGQILRTGAASLDPLIYARACRQVQHVVIESDRMPFPLSPQHILGKKLILFQYDWQVLFCQGSFIVGCTYHRFHAQLGESEIGHMHDVLEEIRIGVGEGPAHVIVFVPALFHESLEFRHDPVVASAPRVIHPLRIMDLFSPVQAQDDVGEFPVGKVYHVVVDEDPVGRERKPEILAVLLLILDARLRCYDNDKRIGATAFKNSCRNR